MTTGTPASDTLNTIDSIDQIQDALLGRAYIADRSLGTALFLALRLGKPLLLEGEAGVGKTEVAKTMADLLGTQLIRLQCYEGLDVSNAVYEWNYAKQMLEIRMLEADHTSREHALKEIFGPEFLIKRPLLQAVEYTNEHPGERPVLLIDEIDRADEEFEAFLLELLSDFQITVPEIGTIKASRPPVVIITSNRTRELHDALKRRCLYHWIDYPSIEKPASRRPRRCWRGRSAVSCMSCAASISTRCRVSPRPSTGPPRSSRSTRPTCARRRSTPPSARSSSIRKMSPRSAAG